MAADQSLLVGSVLACMWQYGSMYGRNSLGMSNNVRSRDIEVQSLLRLRSSNKHSPNRVE